MTKEDVLLSLAKSGVFEIDSEGKIWRVQNRGWHPAVGYWTRPCKRVRAEYRTPSGYLLVASNVNKIRTVAGAHRLVWTHFKGPIPHKLTINHKNGIKDDNTPDNLELATYSEQRIHALTVLNVKRHRPKGSLHPKTKLKEADVIQMREMRAKGSTNRAIAGLFEMNEKAVSFICTRRTWKHI